MTDLVTMVNGIVQPIWGKSVAFNKLAHVWEWKSGERLELNYYIDDQFFRPVPRKAVRCRGVRGIKFTEKSRRLSENVLHIAQFASRKVMPRHMLFTANPGGNFS